MEATMSQEKLSFELFKSSVLRDYRIACLSREISLLGRKEVLGGKAKFGIFGDGKEVAQVAMAKFFKPGDFRSGYYRDQTFVLAAEMGTGEQLFAQLYADADAGREPFSGGRQMNNFFATPFIDGTGEWLNLTKTKNSSSDIAPTAGQMPRALGLAHASRIFRELKELQPLSHLSHQGNEVCFATIGDASTSEGHFWETINAAAVLQVPLAVFVWDDGYGISVPKQYQTAKGSISAALEGMQRTEEETGIQIYKVKGWDYAGMCEAFEEGISLAREKHIPVLFHVEEITQPQGHSTSGSHERYKSSERLNWEKEWDGLVKMKEWLLSNGLASTSELDEIAIRAKEEAKTSRDKAWKDYLDPLCQLAAHAVAILKETATVVTHKQRELDALANELDSIRNPLRRDILRILYRAIQHCGDIEAASSIQEFYQSLKLEGQRIYNSYLYDEGPKSALKVNAVAPQFMEEAPLVNGFEVINRFFEAQFKANPKLVAFGEDLGQIGDVNQGFSGLQEKFGSNDPGLVIECLNGYRLKEKLPTNLLEFSVPLGVPEIIKEGTDITIVSYGSTLRVIQEAAQSLELSGISCEIVDVQTLVPFDLPQLTVQSLQKTNRILFVDEDVPGGAAAYLFNKVMEEQGGYRYLDVAPRTLTAKAHRPAYGSDGDYFSKPNAEEIEEVVREMMRE
ncbi:MAG: hypothetical protein EB047_02005 [Chitinophagaceae bacterium]|nr:hypothetical protein [Chitinophagaceae bacterium]